MDVDQVQDASRHKRRSRSIDQDKNHADKGKSRAPQHIVQISPAGQNRLPGSGVHHQGQGNKAQHLKEEIHGQDILRQGHSQSHPIGGHIKQEKRLLLFLPLHILKPIQQGKRPEKGHKPSIHSPHPIQAQSDAQIMGKTENRKRFVRGMKKQPEHQERIDTNRRLQVNAHGLSAPKG